MNNIQEILLSSLEKMSKYKDINNVDYRCKYHSQESQRWDSYDEFLISFQWKEKKRRVVAYWGGKCFRCKKAYNHIHHLNYMELWGDEKVDRDLLPLCEICHKREHIKFKQSQIISIGHNKKTLILKYHPNKNEIYSDEIW